MEIPFFICTFVKNKLIIMNKPIAIEVGEWWFKGCFIQEQDHPMLSKYVVFKDTELQERVGTASTMREAKKLCVDNEVTDYKFGYKSFLG